MAKVDETTELVEKVDVKKDKKEIKKQAKELKRAAKESKKISKENEKLKKLDKMVFTKSVNYEEVLTNPGIVTINYNDETTIQIIVSFDGVICYLGFIRRDMERISTF